MLIIFSVMIMTMMMVVMVVMDVRMMTIMMMMVPIKVTLVGIVIEANAGQSWKTEFANYRKWLVLR